MMRNLKEQSRQRGLQLASSISQVSRVQRLETIARRDEENAEKLNLAPMAITKLEKNNGDAEKLTKKEIVAILWVKYNITMQESRHKKQKLVDMLRDKMQNTPNEGLEVNGTMNNDGIKGAI